MSKFKIYLKYRFFISRLKKKHILLLCIFLLTIGIFINFFVHKGLYFSDESYSLARALICVFSIITIMYSCGVIITFIKSKECKFLSSFSLSKLDMLFIVIYKTFPFNLIYSFLYLDMLINLDKILFARSVLIMLNSIAIAITISLIEVITVMIFRKIPFIELQIIFFISILLYFIKRLLIHFTYSNISLRELLVHVGNSNIIIFSYNIFFSYSMKQLIVKLIFMLILMILCYYTVALNELKDSKYIFHRVKLLNSTRMKNRGPIVGFLLKDLILIRKNYLFIMSQFIFMAISTIALLQISKRNSIAIFIICSIFIYIFSFVSSDLFKIEESYRWLLKALPLSNSSFLKHKLLNSCIISVISPLVLLLICFFVGKLSFAYFLIYLVLIQFMALVFCLTWCSIAYIFFPEVSKSNIAVLLINFVMLVFPPMVIVVIVISLKIISNKIRNSEVNYVSTKKYKEII